MILNESSGTLGALNATTAATYTDVATYVGVQVSGTWAGTITFQVSLNGTNWETLGMLPSNSINLTTAVTTTTANGVFYSPANLTGKLMRLQMTAYTSGTATIQFVQFTEAK